MDTKSIIQCIILFLLLILSGFFSSAETAFTCVNKVRIRSLAEEGNKRALRVQKIHERYSKMLSTILIGNNLVNIAASSLTTAMTIRLFGSTLIGLSTGVLTFLVLIFGEIIPKNWAGSHADKISLAYCGIIDVLMFLLTPVIWIVDTFAHATLHLFHLEADPNAENITESELRTYVEVGHEEGVLEEEEHHIINNVFDFSDSLAEEIMTPRVDLSTLPITASYEDVMQIFRRTMYTRIPIYEDDPDNIVGMIHMKDFFFVRDPEKFKLKKILRNVYYTYERKKTSDLLMEMREKQQSMAIVLDEYGTAAGLITLEDLLEEIVGEIRDEYDDDEAELIRKVNEHSYLIDAGMKLDDVNDALSLDLSSENYDTIGGIMIEVLDRLPVSGETVTLEQGISLQARGIAHNRIKHVLLKLPEQD